jgi:hypothetical protein
MDTDSVCRKNKPNGLWVMNPKSRADSPLQKPKIVSSFLPQWMVGLFSFNAPEILRPHSEVQRLLLYWWFERMVYKTKHRVLSTGLD